MSTSPDGIGTSFQDCRRDSVQQKNSSSNTNSLPKWQEDSALIQKTDKPLCLICNAILLDHEERTL